MYAICAKIDGQLKYLNRYQTTKYNSSSLETPMDVYQFGELGDYTLMSDPEDWQHFLMDHIGEITEFMTEIEFTNFRAAFTKVKKVITYDTMICNPFFINEKINDNGDSFFSIDGVKWDSFC